MKSKTLIYKARVHTQADGLIANSVAFDRGRIVAVGNNLEHDSEFSRFNKIDLDGRSVFPGFVDAHTHFHYFAKTFGMVSLHGLTSLEACLEKIKKHGRSLGRDEWIVGEGCGPNWFEDRREPDRYLLDKVSGGRPTFIFSKDTHTAYVNSKALELAGIDQRYRDPNNGEIVRDSGRRPLGILREQAAYMLVHDLITSPSPAKMNRYWKKALKYAYSKGITGIHSFDGPKGFAWYQQLAENNQLGLRVNYYPTSDMLPVLADHGIRYGQGDSWLRLAGIKLFADGALGSLTAFCFNKYRGTKNNCGIEVMSTAQIASVARKARRLGFPCAVHAIGDKAVASVLDAFEKVPPPANGTRHRIEHLQLVRRKDIQRICKLGVIASMQPCHLPMDIMPIRKYWGTRSRNTFIFRTLIDAGINLAFGSDVPIEPLDPIAGIAAAVRRVCPGTNDALHPEQRITAAEAVYGFTVGPAIACGQEHKAGYILPGYSADLVVLSEDITRVPMTRVADTKVMATIIDGKLKYSTDKLKL